MEWGSAPHVSRKKRSRKDEVRPPRGKKASWGRRRSPGPGKSAARIEALSGNMEKKKRKAEREK